MSVDAYSPVTIKTNGCTTDRNFCAHCARLCVAYDTRVSGRTCKQGVVVLRNVF